MVSNINYGKLPRWLKSRLVGLMKSKGRFRRDEYLWADPLVQYWSACATHSDDFILFDHWGTVKGNAEILATAPYMDKDRAGEIAVACARLINCEWKFQEPTLYEPTFTIIFTQY